MWWPVSTMRAALGRTKITISHGYLHGNFPVSVGHYEEWKGTDSTVQPLQWCYFRKRANSEVSTSILLLLVISIFCLCSPLHYAMWEYTHCLVLLLVVRNAIYENWQLAPPHQQTRVRTENVQTTTARSPYHWNNGKLVVIIVKHLFTKLYKLCDELVFISGLLCILLSFKMSMCSRVDSSCSWCNAISPPCYLLCFPIWESSWQDKKA